jgi:signal transduction histidine kinase
LAREGGCEVVYAMPMDALDARNDLTRLAGCAVWLSVGLFLPLCVDPAASPALTALLYGLFGALFWIATGSRREYHNQAMLLLLLGQSLCAIWLIHIHAYFMMTGLLVITGWQAAMRLPVAGAVGWIVVQTVGGALLLTGSLGVPLLVSSIGTVFGFQIFALACAEGTRRERIARIALDDALARLGEAQRALLAREREQERLRIARDLHDDLGHGLTAIGMMAAVAALQAENPAQQGHVAAIKREVAGLLRQLRRTVTGLRAPGGDAPQGDASGPDAIDLAKALSALRDQTAWPFAIHVATSGNVAGIDADQGVAIVRLVREAITNAVRHGGSKTSRVVIALDVGPLAIQVAVRDDGRGASAPRFGNGLSGMRERIEALGGDLRLETTPNLGCTVMATVPRTAPRWAR